MSPPFLPDMEKPAVPSLTAGAGVRACLSRKRRKDVVMKKRRFGQPDVKNKAPGLPF